MIKYCSYIVLAIVLIALTVEVGLRITGKYRTAEEIAGEHREAGHLSNYGRELPSWYWRQPAGRLFVNEQPEYSYEHQYNAQGFREKEFNDTTGAKPRVIVLGDSFIEGYGAPADSTFPALLESLMTDSIKQAEVFNMGMGGSDAFFNYMDLRALIGDIAPTHVIMAINSTDIDDYRYTGGFERFREDGTMHYRKMPFRSRIYKRFHIARFWYESVKGMDYTLMTPEELDASIREAAIAINNCIDSTYRLCGDHEAEFILLTYAVYPEICNTELQGLLIENLGNNETPYPKIELTEPFRKLSEDENCNTYGYPVDGHFNSRGYKEMATLFYREVQLHQPGFWSD